MGYLKKINVISNDEKLKVLMSLFTITSATAHVFNQKKLL